MRYLGLIIILFYAGCTDHVVVSGNANISPREFVFNSCKTSIDGINLVTALENNFIFNKTYLKSSIEADNEGHLWIRSKTKTFDVELVTFSFTNGTEFSKYRPKQIQLMHYVSRGTNASNELFLLYNSILSQISCESIDLFPVVLSTLALPDDGQVSIKFAGFSNLSHFELSSRLLDMGTNKLFFVALVARLY